MIFFQLLRHPGPHVTTLAEQKLPRTFAETCSPNDVAPIKILSYYTIAMLEKLHFNEFTTGLVYGLSWSMVWTLST